MPFGVSVAPWAFTMLTREFMGKWLAVGHRASGYIDDQAHAHQTREALATFIRTVVIPDMEALALVINYQISILDPRQLIDYLGTTIAIVLGTLRVTAKRKAKVLALVQEVLHNEHKGCQRRTLEILAGNLMSLRWGFGPIARLMTMSIHFDMNSFPKDAPVYLSDTTRADLAFWNEQFTRSDGTS